MNDYLKTAEDLMTQLSSVELDPRPHFQIVPPAKQEDAPRLWDVAERSEIGYIVLDKNRSNRVYTTTVRFSAKVGLARLVPCLVTIEKKLHESGFTTRLNVDGLDEPAAFHETRVSQIRIALVGGDEEKVLVLKIAKDVKPSDDGNQILLKIGNETEMARFRDGQRTFDFGNLLEFQIIESGDGPLTVDLEKVKGYGMLPIRTPGSENSVHFRDYHISTTPIPRPRSGSMTVKDLADKYAKLCGYDIDHSVRSFVENRIEKNGGRLYEFQNRAILEIASQLSGDRKPCLVIARTAAGKTEAFLVPIINWIIQEQRRSSRRGVKAFFFYPTKALASDQLQRIVEFLHSLNKSREMKDQITVGVYHGDIEERTYLDIPLPLRCVLHEEEISHRKLKTGDVRLRPGSDSVLTCPKCKEQYSFVLADRYSVTVKLPDILVCTPDVINYILMRDKRRHVFFGSKETVKVCDNCRIICYDDEQACRTCKAKTREIEISPEASPQIALLDELHLFSGIFGGNIANFLHRLSFALRIYSTNTAKPLQFVATSATIRNPAEFGRDFFSMDTSIIEATRDEYDYTKTTSKVVVFCSPRAFRMIDSVSYTIYEALRSTDVRLLVFVNSLTVCSMLLTNVKQRLSSDPLTEALADQVDGHNSTYTRQQRAETEEKFNRGEIRVLIATSTLEVGVDFKDLDGMILYGAPYNFNNYLQRVGRAGRNNDAIVFNFLNPNDPIDLYYFRNALRLARDPTEFIEYPPFPTDNDMISQKHALASLFDACALFGVDIVTTLKTFRIDPSKSPEKVRSYLEALWKPSHLKEASRRLRTATVAVVSDKELPDAALKRFKLLDLRRVDETVIVEFDEPYGTSTSTSRFSRTEAALRKLGVPSKDREVLRELRRR